MKLQLRFFGFLLFFLIMSNLYSQTGGGDNPIIPILPDRSVSFAKDIIIKDSSNQKQRQVAMKYILLLINLWKPLTTWQIKFQIPFYQICPLGLITTYYRMAYISSFVFCFFPFLDIHKTGAHPLQFIAADITVILTLPFHQKEPFIVFGQK